MKTRRYLELLASEIMKLLGSTKSRITKEKNDKNVPHLETTEVLLAHYNIGNNDYQQYSRVLYTIVSDKSFGRILDISPSNSII